MSSLTEALLTAVHHRTGPVPTHVPMITMITMIAEDTLHGAACHACLFASDTETGGGQRDLTDGDLRAGRVEHRDQAEQTQPGLDGPPPAWGVVGDGAPDDHEQAQSLGGVAVDHPGEPGPQPGLRPPPPPRRWGQRSMVPSSVRASARGARGAAGGGGSVGRRLAWEMRSSRATTT